MISIIHIIEPLALVQINTDLRDDSLMACKFGIIMKTVYEDCIFDYSVKITLCRSPFHKIPC